MTLIRIRRRVSEIAGVEWIQDGDRKTFASAHYKIHENELKTAYELRHRRTNMPHTHYNQNMRKEEAVRPSDLTSGLQHSKKHSYLTNVPRHVAIHSSRASQRGTHTDARSFKFGGAKWSLVEF